MSTVPGHVRRLAAILGVCFLLGGQFARAATPAVIADFDGDGLRDRVTLDGIEPSVVRVWLSTTGSMAVVRSSAPIISIAARDLDGDRRDELIAGGTRSGLQVWTTRHSGFRRFQPQRAAPATLARPVRHNVEDDPAGQVPADAGTWLASPALDLVPQPRAPSLVAAGLAARTAPTPPSPPLLLALAARPPPLPI